MLIKIDIVENIDRLNRVHKRKLYCLQCDICGKKYITKLAITKKRKVHFCSRKCADIAQKKDGIIHKNIVKTNLERRGVENPLQDNKIKEKRKQTNLEKYGYEHHLQNEEIIEKQKQTNLKRYGYENPLQNENVRSKINYGDIWIKQHETKKKLGLYDGRSKIEDKFYQDLIKIFGIENVDRWIMMFNHEIDFYIKSLDIYIQFDGKYWHGLDRIIEEIKNSNNPRDKRIFETFIRDQEQNEKFKFENKTLLRILDEDYKNWYKNNNDFSYEVLLELANKHPHVHFAKIFEQNTPFPLPPPTEPPIVLTIGGALTLPPAADA
jgi:hypothetical protein